MVSSPKHAEPHSRTNCRSWVGVVPGFLTTVIGLALVGIALWGLWASADVGRLVASASVAPVRHNLRAAAFLLVWLVFFGPFLYFGAAILWYTFGPKSYTWLAPLRLFTFVVGMRAAAEERQRLSRSTSGEKTLPPPRPPEQVGPSPDSTEPQ